MVPISSSSTRDGDDAEYRRGETDREFSAFYEAELAGQIRRATLLIGDRHAARDLVHDAFLELFRRWDRLREPGPYLSTAVLNRCRDHGRRQARIRQKTDLMIVRDQPVSDDLWDALQQLPFNHRAAIILRFHHQMTKNEIAVTLNCRPGSVGPWIQRGLKKLRRDLS
jgi:RNA polymerase sigma factor (sigma-70 family)